MTTYPGFDFSVTYKSTKSKARLGSYKTPHGTIQTPNFIFCGTKAAIKGLTTDQMKEAQTDIILSNTYHLMIQPGADIVAKMGGLHKFMGWDGPMLTDSGGFQIFSMGYGSVADEIKGRRRDGREQTLSGVMEEGALFKSYMDGKPLFLTPEESINIQRKLGADLIVQLDECTAFHVDKDYTEKSMYLSHRWGDRSLAEFDRHGRMSANGLPQAMYGITQGGVYEDLRRVSCDIINSRDFFATAVGGSLGSSKEQMYDVVAMTMELVHPDRPVHLLGIGGFEDIFNGVANGIDTFDCVSPTRIARHGWALMPGVKNGRINLRNATYRDDETPLDDSLDCPASSKYSKAYIYHLFKANEMLGMQLLSMHNVAVMNRLMRDIRQAIKDETLEELKKTYIEY